MDKQSWTSVKTKLAGKAPDQLMATIRDLWNLSSQNKEFLSAKLKTGAPDDMMPNYRQRVREPFFPKRGMGKLELRPAKSAITEYFKITGDLYGKLDLLLYYVECGTEFTNEYGDIDEPFYSSLESVFMQFADICKDKPTLLTPYISRLETLRKNTRNIGWGYGDFIVDEVSELVAMG